MAFQSCKNLSSSRPKNGWDVFLSFRGEDTRYKFTSHLYSALDRYGIRTFMDDPELRTGEVISDALLQAIQDSKTYIVVVSENYASSSWCLDELVEILNCHKTMRRLVIPVIYNIDPSVVRHQTGSFKQAFEKHEIRFAGEMERVEIWRLNLKQVADISGKHIYEKRSEADIIDEIVDEILLKINPRTLIVAKYPVGLDSRVKYITTLLSSKREGVITIGIYGMGGVGKTTLAKALFNQLLVERSFKGSCFLANVRQVSGTANGLVSLQQQLIDDVLRSKKRIEVHNVEQGTRFIRERFCSTKVLLLVDDINGHEQFESLVGPFAYGSVVIITTRDEEILDKVEVETRYRYKVNELDYAQSLLLFTRHAFGNARPNNNLMKLSKDILRHASGLPLALEVFGSFLYKRSEVGFKSYIEKLQRVPNSSIQQRLVISLDALELDDPMLKEIFLDIACFFIGWEKGKVVEIMESYYSYADHNIDILKKRCLLTISDRDKLGMHDLLRDMAREISHNKFPDEPGRHSRLWVSKEILDVLKNHKGTEAIEGIVLCNLYYDNALNGESFTTETFKKMSKLRFIYLNNVNLTGSFEQTFENLRWLCWESCPLECLPSDFYPQKLVVLELPRCRIWELNLVSHVFEKLTTLNMSRSHYLITIRDLTNLRGLETLNLEFCSSLLSISKLPPSLKWMKANNCHSLEKLANLSNLKQLEILDLSYCLCLKEILGLEELTSIRTLRLVGCNSSTLVHTFTKRFFQIYSGFGHHIKIQAPKFQDWMSQFSNAESTMSLDLLPNVSHNFLGMILCFKMDQGRGCTSPSYSLKNTTGDIIWREELGDLWTFEPLIVIVPKSIFSVSDRDRRIELTANGRIILGIHPQYRTDITMIEDVVTKHAIHFDALKLVDPVLQDIFVDIACFFIGWKKEEVVNILGTYYSDTNRNIDILKKRCLVTINDEGELEMHDLLRCIGRKIASNNSPVEPGKHNRLWFSIDIYDVLKKQKGTEAIEGIIPNNLCHNALEGESFTTETFKRMSKLRFLYLEKVNLTGSFEQTFEDLRWLCWGSCPLKCLPSDFYPQKLVILELPYSSMRTMWEPNMVSHVFEKLTTLNMSYSLYLTTTPDFTKLPFLRTLNFNGCKSLEEVHMSIGSLVRIVSLELHGCVKLRSLPDTICNLRELEILDISGCEKLEILPDQLWKLTRLWELNACGATMLKILPDIESSQVAFSLKKLDLSESVLTALPSGISQLSNLEDLNLKNCCNLLSIAELPPNLNWLEANNCYSLKRLPNLSNLKQLEILDLVDCNALTYILGLEELTSLKVLHLTGCNSTLLAYIFTKRLFQMYSEFGHPVQIYSPSALFSDWISKTTNLAPTMSLELPPNVSYNFLGMILCFKHVGDDICYSTNYSVKNVASDFIWGGSFDIYDDESLMVVVPRSIFSVKDGDNRIDLTTTNAEILGIHLLHKTEITMVEEYDSTTVNEDERNYPSKRLKLDALEAFESDKN